MKILSSCGIEHFVETRIFKLCVLHRSSELPGVDPYSGYRSATVLGTSLYRDQQGDVMWRLLASISLLYSSCPTKFGILSANTFIVFMFFFSFASIQHFANATTLFMLLVSFASVQHTANTPILLTLFFLRQCPTFRKHINVRYFFLFFASVPQSANTLILLTFLPFASVQHSANTLKFFIFCFPLGQCPAFRKHPNFVFKNWTMGLLNAEP